MSEINKVNVINSVWVQYVMLVFTIIGTLILISDSGSIPETLGIAFSNFVLILTFGAIVWIPLIVITIVISHFIISEKSTINSIRKLLIGEVLVQTLIIGILVFKNDGEFLEFCTYSVFLYPAQIFRWYYLKRKNRLFNSVQSPNNI